MKKLFTLVTVILFSIILGLYLKQDSGYILIAYKSWIIESGLWAGLIIVLLAVFLVHESIVFFKFIINLPFRTKTWFNTYQQKRIYQQTSQGLLKLAEGNYKTAERLLIKSAKKQSKPLINYLTAAKAAQESKNFVKRDEYLRKAFECSPKSSLSIGLMQANLQVDNQEYEAALATLKHLQANYGNNKLVLKQLLIVYENLKDWYSILKLLPELKRYRIYTSEEIFKYEALTAVNYFNAIFSTFALNVGYLAANYDQVIAKMHEFYNSYLSKKARHNPEVVIAYVTNLSLIHEKYFAEADTSLRHVLWLKQAQKNSDRIIEIIDQIINNNKDAVLQVELFKLFGNTGFTEAHFIILEKHLQSEPYNISLLFALGKVAIKLEDYNKAFQYLNQAKKLQIQNRFSHKLPIDCYFAYVLLRLGKSQESIEIFNQFFSGRY